MDEKYFERQVELFCNEDSDESILDFAKRIYLDGCKAQAEAIIKALKESNNFLNDKPGGILDIVSTAAIEK